MNWGTKIVLGMASFMIFIVALVLIMFNSRKDALVDTDYYEKGINYNTEYNLKEQTSSDHAKPSLSLSRDSILLGFTKQATGEVKMMYTADKSMDKVLSFKSDSHNQVVIPAANLRAGSWRLIMKWTSHQVNYLYEQEITIK